MVCKKHGVFRAFYPVYIITKFLGVTYYCINSRLELVITKISRIIFMLQFCFYFFVYFYYIVNSVSTYSLPFSSKDITQIALEIVITVLYVNNLIFEQSRFKRLFFFLKKIDNLNLKLKRLNIQQSFWKVRFRCVLFIVLRYSLAVTIVISDFRNYFDKVIYVVLFNLVAFTDTVTECQVIFCLVSIQNTFEVITKNVRRNKCVYMFKFHSYAYDISRDVNKLYNHYFFHKILYTFVCAIYATNFLINNIKDGYEFVILVNLLWLLSVILGAVVIVFCCEYIKLWVGIFLNNYLFLINA